MLYEAGTKIDLTYMNTKHEPKVSMIAASLANVHTLHKVGTRYIFDLKNDRMAIRIPVSFA